ncbi:UvrB/UvrC motif-containing protein [Clostridium sp.]|jgi:protein arginine kinase activator|uniref:UvrB/UvrC motif-containing protein n=1 Tax=Clostridium sp. TaxID=1506 RepID=UPI0039F563B9
MLCESCKQREATVHITKIINGVKREANLCPECAAKAGEFNLVSDMDIMAPFSFPNVLSGLMEYMNKNSINNKATELKCEKCGTTYREFKEKGLLGCSECYKAFYPSILSVIKGVQSNVEHTGKVPKKAGKNLVQKNRILKLKEELQKAITLEEYEKAAKIRDEIREIEKQSE